jgi:hypothetical protein
MKELFVALFFAFIISGCGGSLRPDLSPISAYQAGYPTAEIQACGRYFSGIGVCTIKKDAPLSSINMGVQGYFKGTITVSSKRCNIETSFRYEGSKLIPIDIPGTAQDSCNVDITLAPELPNESSTNIEVAPISGRLYIRMLEDGQVFYSQSDKIMAGTSVTMFVPIKPGGSKVRAVFKGCNSTFDKEIELTNGYANIPLDQLITLEKKDCILNGVLFGAQSTVRLSWHVWLYDQGFVQVPLPVLLLEGNKLSIEADPSVTIIALDDKVKVDYKAKFDFTEDSPHSLHLLTTKGRNLFAVWVPGQKTWEWYK